MSRNRKTPESIAFGNRLRMARKNSDYKERKDLANKVGVSRTAISEYENGSSNPSGVVLAKMCSALGVDAAWLYGIYPEEPAGQCPLMNVANQPVGKHEAVYVAAVKKEREEAQAAAEAGETKVPDEDGDLSSALETLDQLIDALDGLMQVVPGYLIEGNAMRDALQGDPNGDKAPAYVSLLSSHPGVVNFYRERTHMRQLAQDGTISPSEYDHWYLGHREKLMQTAVKEKGCEAAPGFGESAGRTPVLKCTAEQL